MAEASRAVNSVNPGNRSLLKSIRTLTATRCLDFPRREHFGVLGLSSLFVCLFLFRLVLF